MALKPVSYNRNLSSDTTRQFSPNIWATCPWASIQDGSEPGMTFFDDFQDFPLIATQTTEINHGKYKVFATTGSAITRISAVNSVEIEGGCMKASTDTDNDSASIAQSYPSYFLSSLTSTSGKLWFECCYAQKSVLTNMAAVFIGLAEVEQWTLATGVPFNASDLITNSASAIGFRILEDGLGVIDTVVSDRATSFTNIGDDEAGTLTAYTFRKLGFVYDPYAASADRIIFYADNQALATRYTGTNILATTNLKANALGLLWASCADSAGTTFEGYLKWWRIAQLMP